MWGRVKKALRKFLSGSLWIVVLTPVLAVSAYSLYYVARHLGVPWYFAWAFSTCFDGAMLLCADYSVKYAQEGMSGGLPAMAVRILCLVAAYLQTLHARISGELPGSWVLWAALPIVAATIYEIHIRWERRKAWAKTGATYPTALPKFGIMTWVLFPYSTVFIMREIVSRRREVLVRLAKDFADRHEGAVPVATEETVSPAKETIVSGAKEPAGTVRPIGSARRSGHAPTRHIRHWAQRPEVAAHYGWDPPGDRARLKPIIISAYEAAHREAEAVGDP